MHTVRTIWRVLKHCVVLYKSRTAEDTRVSATSTLVECSMVAIGDTRQIRTLGQRRPSGAFYLSFCGSGTKSKVQYLIIGIARGNAFSVRITFEQILTGGHNAAGDQRQPGISTVSSTVDNPLLRQPRTCRPSSALPPIYI